RNVTGVQTCALPISQATSGRFRISRRWAEGDVVTLSLPMPARFTWPDPRIDAVRGQVAVERGPLVYCLESADFGEDVESAVIDEIGRASCREREEDR